jgi:hypothetical protein
MTFNDVLLELLGHLRAQGQSAVIGWDKMQLWPDDALEHLLVLGLLVKTASAQSIECLACENHCFVDVMTTAHVDGALPRAFIVCGDAIMQSQMGRVSIPLPRLQQWQMSVKHLAQVTAELLGFKDKIQFTANSAVIKLGMLKGAKGRRWVNLVSGDLSLEINQQRLPIAELLYFDGQQLVIDRDHIDILLNSEPIAIGKQYTPSTTQRETSKLKTQAMYQDWQDAYLSLKAKYPSKSNTWYAEKIRKMDIAKGRDADTIRKHMVK